tara:strand:+ start:109 stop:297 length:189 start_codon:yes stop_codon:yes gene_type:complete
MPKHWSFKEDFGLNTKRNIPRKTGFEDANRSSNNDRECAFSESCKANSGLENQRKSLPMVAA